MITSFGVASRRLQSVFSLLQKANSLRLITSCAVPVAVLGVVTSPSKAQAQTISFSSTIPSSVSRYGKLEATISPFTTTATNYYWPYDTTLPSTDVTGLTVGTGITVNVLLLPPGVTSWANARVQPCFWYQPMQVKTMGDGTKSPTPNSTATWMLRFSPDVVGTWQMKIQVTDSSGVRESAVSSFSCTASTSHGYLRVSPTDSRYFEYADASPFVTAPGIHVGDTSKFPTIKNAFNVDRVWWQASNPGMAPFGMGGQGGLVDWDNSSTGSFAPASDMPAPANHLVIKRLDSGQVMFVKVAPGTQNRTYQWKALVKTVGITGPASTSYPLGASYGPTLYCYANTAGTDVPVNTQWLHGDNDWTWISGTYTNNAADGGFPYMKIGLPNTTGGRCYVAEISVREVLSGGGYGPELAVHTVPNTLQTYNQEDAYNCDLQLNAATSNNMYLKVVCFEKSDVATAMIQSDGTIGTSTELNTYGAADHTPNSYQPLPASTINMQRWLQRAAMRYFAARWGWSPNIHSVEFVNEGDPFSGNHHNGADAFANYVHSVNFRPLMATTTFWHSLPKYWNTTACDYLDVHKYIGPQSGNNPALQEAYGSWPLAPTVTDPVRGQVLQIVSNTVNDWQPSFWLSPMPITVGHTYRIRFWLKGQDLSKTGAPYPQGPGFSVRILNAHTNGDTLQDWNSGILVTPGDKTGTFDWEERLTPTFTVTDSAAKYMVMDAEMHYTSGTAQFDDIRLEDTTAGTSIHVPNGTFDEAGYIKYNTALLPVDAWEQYAGGGGTLPRPYNKPIMWGELGISGDNNYGTPYMGFSYNGQDQDLYKDTGGVWLHKITWAGVNPGNVQPLIWWNDTITTYNLYASGTAYRTFMTGIPINNGYYVNAQPVSTGGLRAWGQKDLTARRAHLWIDNPNHTWFNVVNNVTIPTVSGTVKVNGLQNSKWYTVQWWNTQTGAVSSTQTLQTEGTGVLTLTVTNLATDTAVKIIPLPVPAAPTITATAGAGGITVAWNSVATATGYTVKRSTTSGGPYTVISTPTSTSYLDSAVTTGTTYYYVVTANNQTGSSANSAQKSAIAP